MPEYHLKIQYPASWTKVESDFTDQFTKVIFGSPKESPSDPWIESFLVGVLDLPSDLSLKRWLEMEL
jgi:hypothetical protein